MLVDYKDMIRHLEGLGFTKVSHKGSHAKYKYSPTAIVIIPVNTRKTLKKGVLHRINKSLEINGLKTYKKY